MVVWSLGLGQCSSRARLREGSRPGEDVKLTHPRSSHLRCISSPIGQGFQKLSMGKKRSKKNKKRSGGGGLDAVNIIRGSLPSLTSGGNRLTSTQSVGRVVGLDVPIAPIFFTVTAASLASAAAINSSLIPTFSTRFGSTFVEYRLLGMRARLRMSEPGTATAGIAAFYLDEKSASAPTLVSTLDHVRLEVSLVTQSNDKIYEIDWKANDLLDVEWTPIGTVSTPVWLKGYTDAANFGAAGTIQYVLTGAVRLQFRGLQ